MKKHQLLALAAAAAVCFTSLGIFVEGGETTYDSSTDPLVSVSYLNDVIVKDYESKISDLKAKNSALEYNLSSLKNKNAALESSIGDLKKEINSLNDSVKELNKVSKESFNYQAIYLAKGQTLLCSSACEVILRTGAAVVVSPTINGINDMTDGTDLYVGDKIPLYHTLLISRGGDGRGVKVTSDGASLMVRGVYYVAD